MKVAIDGRALTVERTGGGDYTYHLIDEFSNSENEYLVCAHKPLKFGFNYGNISVRVDRFPMGVVWQQIGLPGILSDEKVDVFHSPLFTLPLRLPGRRTERIAWPFSFLRLSRYNR